ncbi:MAG: TolC family protein [Saprospiraceae bacterium]
MKKSALILLLGGIALAEVAGQKMLAVGNILAAAQQDAVVLAQAGHIAYARTVNPQLPLVNQVSLRSQTDRLELERQRYAVRVSLNGFRQIRAEQNVQRADLFVAESRQRNLLHAALAERYETLIAYRQAEREIDLCRQLSLVFQDKIAVLKARAAYAGDADLEELIEAEYDLDENALRLMEAEQALQESREMLVLFTPGAETGSELDTTGFLTPNRLLFAATTVGEQVVNHPGLIENTAKAARAEAQYQAEKARSQQLLDFVQVRHDNRPSEPLSRDISFAIGINLPFRGTSAYKMAELKIEKNAAETALAEEQADAARRVREAKARLAALDTRYRQATQLLFDNQSVFTLRQAGAGIAADPMVLLRAKELVLKRQQRLLDIEADMYAQYLNLLDWSGQLSVEPLMNYLGER